MLNELLQLVPVTRTILLTVYADKVLHLRNGSLTRHLRRTTHARHLRNATHLTHTTHRLLTEGIDAVVHGVVQHTGIEIGLVSTHKGLLGLQTRGTLHLLTLNAHCLALILKVHALQFLLTAEVKFLLSAHSVQIKRRLLAKHVLLQVIVEVEVRDLGIVLSHHALLLQVGSKGS